MFNPTAQLEALADEARDRYAAAQVARFTATGGADLGLAWALEYHAMDLELTGANGDPLTWSRAMRALRMLAARQQ